MAARRPRTDAPKKLNPAANADGWENVYTGLGSTGRDKRRGASPVVLDLAFAQAEALYRADDMAARIIDDPPREMIRKGVDIMVGEDSDAAEAIEARLDELEVLERLRQALTWERAYGGSAIVIGAEDGVSDQAKPLDVARLKAVRWLSVVHAHELIPSSYYGDPTKGTFGEPEVFQLSASHGGAKVFSAPIHETRLIRFTGIQTSRLHSIRKQSWGDSVMVRVLEVLSDFGQVWGGAGALIQDFSQAIFKIRGLTELIASGREDVVRKRLEAIEMGRSIVRAAVLDAGDGEPGSAGEEFERKVTPLTGYPEMLQQFCLRLAAASDMPVSRLMGQSPAGLNATGAADITWWTERIEGLQKEKLRRPLNRLVKLLLLSKEGPTKGVEPELWSVRFRPLRQITPLEEADRRLKNAQGDAAYVQAGVLTPEEVAVARFGGDDYGEDLVADTELRERMERPEPDDAEAAALLAGAAPGAGALPDGAPPAPAEAVDPSTALNGAQVASLLEVIQAVAGKLLPRETGVAVIAASFPLSPEEADRLMGEVGRTFFAEAPEPPPSPFGGKPSGPPDGPPRPDDEPKQPKADTTDTPRRVVFERDQDGRIVGATLTTTKE